MRAVEVMSGHKLFSFLQRQERKGAMYQVLINKRPFLNPKKGVLSSPEDAVNTELAMHVDNLKSIDIVPILEGADTDILGIVLGAVLIVIGVVISLAPGFQPIGAALIVGGIGMVAAGVINLLSSPPSFGDLPEFDSAAGKQSYLFNGAINTVREGGPVPVGYGRLIVGSQVISVTTVYEDTLTEEQNQKDEEIQEELPCFFDPRSINDSEWQVGTPIEDVNFQFVLFKDGGSCAPDTIYSFNWALRSGTIPPGLTFEEIEHPDRVALGAGYETKTAKLSGTPTTAGTYKFTIAGEKFFGSFGGGSKKTWVSRTYTVTIKV